MVVVAVRDQHGVEPGHVGGGDRKLNHHRHVETAQQRIDHHRRAATVDQEPGHAQPPQGGPVAGLKGFRAERLCLWGLGLDAVWPGPYRFTPSRRTRCFTFSGLDQLLRRAGRVSWLGTQTQHRYGRASRIILSLRVPNRSEGLPTEPIRKHACCDSGVACDRRAGL